LARGLRVTLTAMLSLLSTELSVFWSQVALILSLAGALVLVWWPFVEAVKQRRVGWAAAIIVLAPLGGIAWFITGRGHAGRSAA
jgi:hypothetical protein